MENRSSLKATTGQRVSVVAPEIVDALSWPWQISHREGAGITNVTLWGRQQGFSIWT
jgi:hypothetical protein